MNIRILKVRNGYIVIVRAEFDNKDSYHIAKDKIEILAILSGHLEIDDAIIFEGDL